MKLNTKLILLILPFILLTASTHACSPTPRHFPTSAYAGASASRPTAKCTTWIRKIRGHIYLNQYMVYQAKGSQELPDKYRLKQILNEKNEPIDIKPGDVTIDVSVCSDDSASWADDGLPAFAGTGVTFPYSLPIPMLIGKKESEILTFKLKCPTLPTIFHLSLLCHGIDGQRFESQLNHSMQSFADEPSFLSCDTERLLDLQIIVQNSIGGVPKYIHGPKGFKFLPSPQPAPVAIAASSSSRN